MPYPMEWRKEALWIVLLGSLILAGSAVACLVSTDASAGAADLPPSEAPMSRPGGAAAMAALSPRGAWPLPGGPVGFDAVGAPIMLP